MALQNMQFCQVRAQTPSLPPATNNTGQVAKLTSAGCCPTATTHMHPNANLRTVMQDLAAVCIKQASLNPSCHNSTGARKMVDRLPLAMVCFCLQFTAVGCSALLPTGAMATDSAETTQHRTMPPSQASQQADHHTTASSLISGPAQTRGS